MHDVFEFESFNKAQMIQTDSMSAVITVKVVLEQSWCLQIFFF